MRGFTLLELSIVLVIIGLLVGGVMVGRDMIEIAHMRGQAAQIETLKSASMAFRDKYFYLPGDAPNMTQFFPSATQPSKVINGNGDGMILGGDPLNLCAYTWGGEWSHVFDHLAAAALVSQPQYDDSDYTVNRAGYSYPLCKAEPSGSAYAGNGGAIAGFQDCGVILSYEFTGHFFRIGIQPFDAWAAYHYNSFGAGFTPAQALRYDVKFDDGLPATGGIQVANAAVYMCQPGPGDNTPANVGNCANWAANTYKTTDATRYCSLRVKAGF